MSALKPLLQHVSCSNGDGSPLVAEHVSLLRGRGLCFTAAVPRGTVVMSIPPSVLLTADRARAELPPSLAAAVNTSPSEGGGDEAALALHVLAAVAGGATAPLRAYVRALPRLSDLCQSLVLWSKDELSALGLPPWAASAVAERQSSLRRGFEAALSAAVADASASVSVSSSGSAFAASVLAALSWPNFVWARLCVQSRAFHAAIDDADALFAGADGTTSDLLSLALVPLGDMCNHACEPVPVRERALVNGCEKSPTQTLSSSPRAVCCDADWRPASASDAGAWFLRTPVAARAGDEVCISYGDLSSLELLDTYGFSIAWPGNANETLAADVTFLKRAAFGGGCYDGDSTKGSKSSDGVWARSLADAAAALFADRSAATIISDDTASAAALAAIQRELWEMAGAPEEIELPCSADDMGADSLLLLLRVLALDLPDARALGTPPRLDRLERPLSPASEARARACARLLVMSSLAPIVGRAHAGEVGEAAAVAVLQLPLGEQVAAIRAALLRERSLCVELEASVAAAVAAQHAAAAAASGSMTPWPDTLPLLRETTHGDVPQAGEVMLDVAAFVGSNEVNVLRRAATAATWRESQLAVGLLHLLHDGAA